MNIKIEFTGIKVNERWVKSLNLEKIALQEVLTSRTRILSNVAEGRGTDGQQLRPYSPGYRKLKIASGRSGETDLNVSGELLRSMTARQMSNGGEVVFSGNHSTVSKLRSKTAKKKQSTLPATGGTLSNAALAESLYNRGFVGWFNFGREDVDRITKRFTSEIDRALKNLLK